MGITSFAEAQIIVGQDGPDQIDTTSYSGAQSLQKIGTNSVILSSPQTYTGITTVTAGTLQFAKQASLYDSTPASWTAANLTTSSGATLAFSVGGDGEFTAADLTILLTTLGSVNNDGLLAGSRIGFDTTNAAGGSFTVSDVIGDSTGSGGGSIGLTKLGIGTLLLSSANTYSGATTVVSGTLSLGSAARLGTGAVTLSGGRLDLGNTSSSSVGLITIAAAAPSGDTISNGSITATSGYMVSNESGNVSISANLGGTGQLTKSGAGTLTLAQANSRSGFTHISGGTLVLGGVGSLGTGVVSLAGGQLDLGGSSRNISSVRIVAASSAGDTVTNGNLFLSPGQMFRAENNSGNAVVSANLRGVDRVEKIGAGVLTLAGTNTYGGTNIVAGGTLQFAKQTSLYNNNTASWTAANLTANPGATLAFNVGGVGEFTQANVTTLLTNLGTVNNNGLRAGASIGFDTTNAPAGTFTIPNAIVNSVGSGGGALGLAKLGTGTLVLTGTNTYSGFTRASSGTLQFAKQTSLYNNNTASWTAANLTASPGATLAFNVGGVGEFTQANVTTLLTNLGTVSNNGLRAGASIGFDTTNASRGLFTISSVLADSTGPGGGAIGVVKLGTGTLVLTEANTNSGPTVLNSGTLQFAKQTSLYNNNTASWTAANLTASPGATLAFNVGGVGEFTTADVTTLLTNLGTVNNNGLRAGASIGFDTTNAAQPIGVLRSIADSTGAGGGAIGVTKLGPGTLVFTQPSTYTGETVIAGGTLRLNSPATLGMGAATLSGGRLDLGNTSSSSAGLITIAAGAPSGDTISNGSITATGYLVSNESGNVGISANLGGTGPLTKSGAGTLTLAGTNAYTGVTTVSAGTLTITRTAALPGWSTAGRANVASGVLAAANTMVDADFTILRGVTTVSANGFVGFDTSNGDRSTSVVIEGSKGFAKVGPNTLTLVSAIPANYTGGTFVAAGGTLAMAADASQHLAGDITGSGVIRKQGAGVLTLSGMNTFTGSFQADVGTLQFAKQTSLYNNNTASWTAANLTANPGATLAFNVGGVGEFTQANVTTLLTNLGTVNNNGLRAGASIGFDTTNAPAGTFTIPNAIVNSVGSGGGALGLAKLGAGTLVLTGTNTYSGSTAVLAGTLSVGNGGTTGSITGNVILADGTTLKFNRSNSQSYDGLISGGSVIKAGSGSLTLGGTIQRSLLIEAGSLTIASSLGVGGLLTNTATVTLPSSSAVLTAGTAGLVNDGTVQLSGGTVLSDGVTTNNGNITGYGTLGGEGRLINNAQVSQVGGSLTLASAVKGLNAGNFDLASGLQFRLTGAGIDNTGTLNLNGASVTGTGALTNAAGGTVAGRGLISAPFANAGGVLAPGGGSLNVPNGFSNSGVIRLSENSALSGGTIANIGRIQGDGSVANRVTNEGRLEPIGTLTIGGLSTNAATGLISAATGNSIVFTQGLTTNAAVINLTGGQFDNNGHPLTNTGQISGHGVLSTGGLTNTGVMTLTGGLSTVNGDVTNSASGRIEVRYNPAIFSGAVTNAAGAVFKTYGTTTTFVGTFTNDGVFASDPAENFFADLVVGELGALTGEVGDRFVLSGDLISTSTNNIQWDTRLAELRFSGGTGLHEFVVGGIDYGATTRGYTNNFAWGILGLASGNQLTLIDGLASGGALYVGTLKLDGGLPAIQAIQSNGVSIYYDPTVNENAYLEGATYVLPGGGLLSAVPEPGAYPLVAAAFASLLYYGTRLRPR